MKWIGNIMKFKVFMELFLWAWCPSKPTVETQGLVRTFYFFFLMFNLLNISSLQRENRSITVHLYCQYYPWRPFIVNIKRWISYFTLQIMYHWTLSIIQLLISCCFSPVIRIVLSINNKYFQFSNSKST